MTAATLTTRPWRADLDNCPPLYATARNPARPNRMREIRVLAELMGIELIPAQEYILSVATEVHDDGTPYYQFIVVSVPRQTGKTEIIGGLMVVDRMLNWLTPQFVVLSAQNLVDSRDVIRSKLVPRLKRSRDLWLAAGFTPVLGALGTAHVRAETTGSTLRLVSSGKSAGHGTTLHLVVVDEAWSERDASREQALRPAQAAVPDPQYLVLSTAGDATSTYLRGLIDAGRKRVEAGYTGRAAFFEWGAPDSADPSDPQTWRRACPALGWFHSEERHQQIHDDFAAQKQLNEFRRAFLNQWVEAIADPPIPAAAFDQIVDRWAEPAGRLYAAVDARPERDSAYMAVSDGRTIEIVKVWQHTAGMADLILRAWDEHKDLQAVVGIHNGPLAGLLDDLEDQGVNVERAGIDRMRKACGAFYDAVLNERVKVRDSNLVHLRRALAAVKQHQSGNAWLWARLNETLDIACLWAATLAFHSAVVDLEPANRVVAVDPVSPLIGW